MTGSSVTTVHSSNVHNANWREVISDRLIQRKRIEQEPFEELIHYIQHVFDSIDTLRNENLVLTIQREKLTTQLNLLTNGTATGNLDSLGAQLPSIQGPSISLEDQKRILQLQEQLTELHKQKGEKAQMIVDLRDSLEEKEKEIRSLRTKNNDLIISVQEYKNSIRRMEQTVVELEDAKQTLLDEHSALQMAYSSLESKFMSIQKDHTELIKRYMEIKARDAEALNRVNEQAHMAKLEQQKQQLALAIQDMPPGSELERENANLANVVRSGSLVATANISICPRRKLIDFESHEGEVNAVKWLPESHTSGKSLLLTGGGDRKVKLWEVQPEKSSAILRVTLAGSNATITSIDVENDMILASSNDFASRVWTMDGKLRRTLTGHSNKVLAVKFFSTATRVVSGSHDRTLKLWDLNRHACTRTLFAGSSCNDLVVTGSTDSGIIISGHFDKKIRFWDTRNEGSANEINLEGRITSLAISNDGSYLLAAVRDDTLRQLDLRQKQVVRTFLADGFKIGCDWTRAAFSPDNQYVAAGSNDGSVYIWNSTTGKADKILKETHSGHNVITCAWNSTGNLFVSCDKSKKSVIWVD